MADLSEDQIAEKWRNTIIPGQGQLDIMVASNVDEEDEAKALASIGEIDISNIMAAAHRAILDQDMALS